MSDDAVPHGDFAAGYIIGFQAVMGTGAAIPNKPLAPMTVVGMTQFLMGVRAGLEAAGVEL